MASMIERKAIVELLSELVRIPSVNPRMAGGAGEQALARSVAERLRGLGLTPEIVEVEADRPNVVATAPGAPGGPHLVFEAHLDTVSPAHDQRDPFVPRLEGDRLFGRGACDTKASMAAMLLAFESVRAVRARRATLTLAFLMGEELGHEGARHLVRSGFRADGAVVGEPTGLQVIVAHKGVLRWRMTALGQAAHSAHPDRGRNAIVAMARIIRALDEELIPRLAERWHPLLGPPTLSIGRIEGGTQVNVVPDRCTIDLDRRVLPGESWADVRAEVEGVLRAPGAGIPEDSLLIEAPYQDNAGMETAPDAPIVRLARDAVRRVDTDRPLGGVPYCTDAAAFAAAGIPCVVLGPGDIAQAHTSAEYVDIPQVIRAAEIYREMMLQA
jgi:acetylornithine deacetylase